MAADETGLAVPRQMPAGASVFVGRQRELGQLSQLIDHSQEHPASRMAVISALAGVGGVGKTCIALYWAHQNQEHFPDGQLYVNLRGYDPAEPPRDPSDVLGDFLRGLGIGPAMLPETMALRAAMFRTLVADRRMLLILDNARTAAQVRPLLPGGGNCFVLVTSRDSLAGLVVREGAYRIDLDVLGMDEAIDLIKRTMGEPVSLDNDRLLMRLADLCGRLPLALLIAAERIAGRPAHDIEDLVESLGQEKDRLDLLATADDDSSTAIKSVFSWSYKALSTYTARFFRILALHPGPHFSAAAAAALVGESRREAKRGLETLIAASLLENSGTSERYHFHDLVRLFAQQCVMEHESVNSREQSLRRECLWYVNATDTANRRLSPHRTPIDLRGLPSGVPIEGISTFEEALNWFDFERPNLMGVMKAAAAAEMFDLVWKMATAAWSYYELRKYLADWTDSHELGLLCVQRINNIRGECRVRDNLGIAYRESGRLADAADCLERALELWRHTGFVYGEAATLDNLGCVYLDAEDFLRSREYLESALTLNRQIGDRWGEARVINNIGRVFLKLDNADDAILRFTEATDIYREVSDKVGEGRAVSNWGRALTSKGDYEEAILKFTYSLALQQHVGDRHGEAATLGFIADVSIRQDHISDAIEQLNKSMSIFRELGDPRAQAIQKQLDELTCPVAPPSGMPK